MQIVARKQEFPTPLFNFCSRTLFLVTREAELRKKLRPGDNSHRAAQLADDVLQLVRACRALPDLPGRRGALPVSTQSPLTSTFAIPISSGIFAHCQKIGIAIWVFIWMIDRTTKEVSTEEGCAE